MNCKKCKVQFTLGKGQPCKKQGCRKIVTLPVTTDTKVKRAPPS